MVQLSPLRNWSPRRGGDRIGVDREIASPTHRDKAAMNGAQPGLCDLMQMRVNIYLTNQTLRWMMTIAHLGGMRIRV